MTRLSIRKSSTSADYFLIDVPEQTLNQVALQIASSIVNQDTALQTAVDLVREIESGGHTDYTLKKFRNAILLGSPAMVMTKTELEALARDAQEHTSDGCICAQTMTYTHTSSQTADGAK